MHPEKEECFSLLLPVAQLQQLPVQEPLRYPDEEGCEKPVPTNAQEKGARTPEAGMHRVIILTEE